MFTVASKQEQINLTVPTTSFALVYQPSTFNRVPIRSQASAQTDFSFNDPFYFASLEGNGLNLKLGFGSGIGAYDGTALNFAISFVPELYLYRSSWLQIVTPFQVKTEFLRIRAQSEEFAQNTGSLGTGIGINLIAKKKYLFSSRIQRSIGYNVRGFGTNQGRFLGLEIPTRILVGRLVNRVGITLGHTYVYGNMDLSDSGEDYNFYAHSFVIGINF